MKKLFDKVFKKKLIIFVELDKAKFRKNKQGSCETFMVTGVNMPIDKKKEAQEHINKAIDLIREYIEI